MNFGVIYNSSYIVQDLLKFFQEPGVLKIYFTFGKHPALSTN